MDSEFKKLLAGDSWAESGDRIDMNDPSVQPIIDRSQGYNSDFSTTTTPARARINQILRELYGAAKEVRMGVSEYDAEVEYPQGAICQFSGDLYYALAAHDPAAAISPGDPGQTSWASIGGRTAGQRTIPGEIQSSNIFIDNDRADQFSVWWYPSDNGGLEITSTQMRYSKDINFVTDSLTRTARPGSTVFTLTNRDSDLYYVSLRSRNQLGWGPWSTAKRVKAVPVDPGNVLTTQVFPTGSGGVLAVQWYDPELNGLSVSKYRVQWASGNQQFSTTERFIERTSRSAAITNLDENTRYSVRVQVISNRNTVSPGGIVAYGTPRPVSDTPDKPVITAESVSATRLRAWISTPLDHNGSDIDYYTWAYRVRGTSTWTTENTSNQSYILKHTRGTLYDIRVRAHNANGNSSYSDTAQPAAFTPSRPEAPEISVGTSNSVVPGLLKGVVYFSMGNISTPEVTKDRIIQTSVRWAPTGSSSFTEQQDSSYPNIDDEDFSTLQSFPPTGNVALDTPLDVQARWRNAGGWSDWSDVFQLGAVSAPSGNLTLSSRSLSIREGESATMTVRLSRVPIEDVTVAITSSNSDLTTSASSLTFTEFNWDQNQTITLTAATDSDELDDSATLTLRTSGGLDVSDDIVNITIKEPIKMLVSFTDGTINIPEGGNAAVFVGLTGQPSSNVIVSVTKTGSSDITLSETTLTFRPSNWQNQQSVTVNAAADDDTTNDTGTLTFTATGGAAGTATRNVVVADDVTRVQLQVDPAGFSIGKSLSKTFEIRPAAVPAAAFVLNIKPLNPNQVTVSPSSMTFTRLNWQTRQTCTVTIPSTAVENANEWISLEPQNAPDIQPHSFELITTTPLIEAYTRTSYIVPEGNRLINVGAEVNGTWTGSNAVVITPSSLNSDLSFSPTSRSVTSPNTNATFIISAAKDSDIVSENIPVIYTSTGGLSSTLSIPTMMLESTNGLRISSAASGVSVTQTNDGYTIRGSETGDFDYYEIRIGTINVITRNLRIVRSKVSGLSPHQGGQDNVIVTGNTTLTTSSRSEVAQFSIEHDNNYSSGATLAVYNLIPTSTDPTVSLPILQLKFIKR